MINLIVIGICTAALPHYVMNDKMDCILKARECISSYDIHRQDEIEVIERCAKQIAEQFDDGSDWCS